MNGFLAWVTGIVALVVPGFGTVSEPVYTGYLEANYVYAAPATPGTIEMIAVKEGQLVKQGDLLFALSSSQQQALLKAAQARVEAARATWQNLETGSRIEEIDVIRATLSKAEADLALATATAERTKQLFDSGLTPQAKVDQDQATLASAIAQVEQLRAQLAVAELPARDSQQLAAKANLIAAEADADKARHDLEDRTIRAPAAGRVEKLYFDLGEMAGAGVPVVSILPETDLTVKFYVDEMDRASFALGDVFDVSCDGCASGLHATLTQLASDPQFTAPIIYSRDERNRLVYLAEASLDFTGGLLPGQPVTVKKADQLATPGQPVATGQPVAVVGQP